MDHDPKRRRPGAPHAGGSGPAGPPTRRRAEPPAAPAPPPDAEAGERLNRYLARAGVAARRAADALIAEGRVRVNGAVETTLGARVRPGDRVEVDGREVAPRHLVYILLNKTRDAITTTDDERGRRTVLDLLDGLPEEDREGLFPVGRLDRDTTGALLLTNDGELAHRLMHPRYGAEKLYLVETRDPVRPDELDRLRRGVNLDDGPARADQVGYVTESRHQVAVQLHEGRNRQVRRMFEALGHTVAKLDRVGYAGLTLERLRRGRWRRLHPHEVNALRARVKLRPIVFEEREEPRRRRRRFGPPR